MLKTRRFLSLMIAATALVLALSYHFNARSGGIPHLLNLDDGYIHSCLADNLAKTGILGLNPGEKGGGSSSAPWTLLLTLLVLAGIKADLAAWIMSLISWVLAAWAMARLSYSLYHNNLLRWIASGAVALSGQMAMTALSGMETLLFLAFVLLALESYSNKSVRKTVLWLVLATLTRPEGMILAVSLASNELLNPRKTDDSNTRINWLKVFTYPASAGLSFLAGSGILTVLGGNAPATLAARRWLFGMPPLPWSDPYLSIQGAGKMIQLTALRLRDFMGPGHGLGFLWMLLITGLFLIYVIWIWRKSATVPETDPGGEHKARTLRVIVFYLIFHLMFLAFLLPSPGQLGRYAATVWALLPFTVIGGWQVVSSWLQKTAVNRLLPYVAALLIAAYLPQVYHWAVWHKDTVRHLAEVHLQMANEVKDRIPPNQPVAVFDIGLISWITPHKIIDLGGLTSAESLHALENGEMPELVDKYGARYIVLPESAGRHRWIVANQLRFNPNELRELKRFTLQGRDHRHIEATLVALPAAGLYEWIR